MARPTDRGRFILLSWVILVFLEIALVILFVPPERIAQAIQNEKQICLDQLGEDACVTIRETTDAWYRAAIEDSGAKSGWYGYFFTRHDAEDPYLHLDDRGMESLGLRVSQTMFGAIYIVFWRACIAVSWLPWFTFIALAVVADAIVRWKIGHWRFSYRSPIVHHAALTAIILAAAVFLFIVVLPITLTPFWAPAGFAFVLASVWALIANMQKRV